MRIDTHPRRWGALFAIAFTVLAAASIAARASAATYTTVGTTSDLTGLCPGPSSGTCSLRGALIQYQHDLPHNPNPRGGNQQGAPTVQAVSPGSGPSAGGTSVAITGTRFTGATAVDFGITPATKFTVDSRTQITATAPPGTGTVGVTATTPCGTSATGTADQYTYVPAPTVTGISQTSGPTAGGTTVTITGTHFTGATGIDFGKTPATKFTLDSDTRITATAPTGTGTVDVTVTTDGVTSAPTPAAQFTYVPLPTVTGVSPPSGPAAGGTSVTISGANLTGATTVDFGSTAATNVSAVSASQITATSPAGSGTIDVTVTTAGGTSALSSADQFSYEAAPAITGLPTSNTGPPSVLSSIGAALSGTVDPNGLPTTAHFEYELDPRYSGQGSSTVVYNLTTPDQPVVGPLFAQDFVSAAVSGLLPNALYHVRLVATNSDGTTVGPDRTFTTKEDPAPAPPVLGKSFDVKPVSGIVFVRLPHSKSPYAAADAVAGDALARGRGFLPLTETRRLPAGTQVDAREGTLNLITATGQRGKTQTGTFSGAIFGISQDRKRIQKGLTTLTLLEGLFLGAPTYASCKAHAATDSTAQAALSSKVLQALRASDHHGNFRTKGRFSAATVRGTAWGVRDRCDGTLTTVRRGTVVVTDFVSGKTITLHAGQAFLARATVKKRK